MGNPPKDFVERWIPSLPRQNSPEFLPGSMPVVESSLAESEEASIADPPKEANRVIGVDLGTVSGVSGPVDKLSLDELVRRKPLPSEPRSEKISERDFVVGITIFGAAFGTGLFALSEGYWWFGSVYTAGGAIGLLSMSPLVQSRIGSWPSQRTLMAVALGTWLFLGANIGFAVYDHFWPKGISSITPAAPVATGRVWAPLSKDEQKLATFAINILPKREHFRVICLTTDCKDLARDFTTVFHDAGWNPVFASSSTFFQEPYGIVLYLKNPNDKSLAEAIEKTTNLKIDHVEASSDPTGIESLFIGIRP